MSEWSGRTSPSEPLSPRWEARRYWALRSWRTPAGAGRERRLPTGYDPSTEAQGTVGVRVSLSGLTREEVKDRIIPGCLPEGALPGAPGRRPVRSPTSSVSLPALPPGFRGSSFVRLVRPAPP